MKKNLYTIWLVGLLLIGYNYARAASYYFSTLTGDDSRSTALAQDPKTPWKTIDKLNAFSNLLQPGDSVLFKKGEVFSGGMVLTKSGTKNDPIVIAAYGAGQNPVINGFYQILNWRSVGGGIYESDALTAKSAVNMVVIDGINYAMGRYPNADATNKGYLNFESHSANSITDNNMPAGPNWTGAELVVRTKRWLLDRTPITNQNGSRLSYTSLTYEPTNGYGYFIQNDLKTLDQKGEWYFNPTTKKLYIYFGTAGPPTNSKVQASVVDVLFDVTASHIVLENLSLTGANNYAISGASRNMDNLTVKNCQISFSGIDGVHFEGISNFNMEKCTILNSNNDGIDLGYNSPYTHLKNNVIQNTGLQAGMGRSGDSQYLAIFNRSKGLVAEYNKIINTGYSGIDCGSDSITVKNNYINNFCRVKDDGGGIYTYVGTQNTVFSGRKIIGNIILNGIGAPEGTSNSNHAEAEGIYLDDNTNNIEVSGNTVAFCGRSGAYMHNARNFRFNNNTSFNNKIQLLTIHDNLGNPIVGGEILNNIFFSTDVSDLLASFRSIADDIDKIGKFENNYYARPFNDNLTIFTEKYANSATSKKRIYDLAAWKIAYGKDQGSEKSPVDIQSYSLIGTYSNNKYSNSKFNNNIEGLYCWSPSNDCSAFWEPNNFLDQGALKVSAPGSSHVTINFGAAASTKQYLLRFSAVADFPSNLEVYLRQSNYPYENISKTQGILVETKRGEYELLFSFPTSEAAASIEFYSGNVNLTYWLDNIELYEANATLADPADHVRFEYNPTLSDTTIFLGWDYIDVKKKTYSDRLILKPFESVILIKDTTSQQRSARLFHFQSSVDGCKVLLNWIFDITERFSHFELEKSLNNSNFTNISRLAVPGGIGQQSFSYTDKQAGRKNFYRLKIVDTDGNFTYSPIFTEQTYCHTPYLQLYPTVLSRGNQELTIKLYTEKSVTDFTVVDQLGRVLKTKKVETNEGWNVVTWDVSDLPSGLFYLHHSDVLLNGIHTFIIE